PSARPTWARPSGPACTSRCPSWPPTRPSLRVSPQSTTSRFEAPVGSTRRVRAASTTSPTKGAWALRSTRRSRRCRTAFWSSSASRRRLKCTGPPKNLIQPTQTQRTTFSSPPPDPHLSARNPYTSLLFFRSNKTKKRKKKILLGAIWWERLLSKTLLVDSCKQILSSPLLVSLAVKRHFYAFWGLAKENRLLLLLLLLLMKAGGDLSNKKKLR
ncbi:hypothetical protein IscW_ISCW015389, partial [Ixodes scapularis]